MTNLAEKKNLEKIAENSKYCERLNLSMIKYSYKILKQFLKRDSSVLEMGPAEGVMTEKLVNDVSDLTIVEGSEYFTNLLKDKYPQVEIYNSLFENYQPNKKFDVIILGHVLEHVENPTEILKRAKNWLNKEGIIFAAVPNCHSIYRQAAVLMGILEKENSMSELDKHHGHRRVYSKKEFENDFITAGLKIFKSGGYWLKPLSNGQMKDWDENMIEAFMKLGEKYPDIAAENYVIASLA